MTTGIDDGIRVRLLANGWLTTRDATELGVDHHRLAHLVRRGDLVRVRSGAYVDGASHRAADPVQRHRLEVVAVTALLGPAYAVTHLSAVVVHDLPVLHRDVGPVEVAPIGAGRVRRDGRLWVHAPVAPDQVVPVPGCSARAPG